MSHGHPFLSPLVAYRTVSPSKEMILWATDNPRGLVEGPEGSTRLWIFSIWFKMDWARRIASKTLESKECIRFSVGWKESEAVHIPAISSYNMYRDNMSCCPGGCLLYQRRPYEPHLDQRQQIVRVKVSKWSTIHRETQSPGIFVPAFVMYYTFWLFIS